MWLLIDDTRNLNVDVIARTAVAGIKLLRDCEWDCVCLDHDLAEEKTGLDVLRFAINHDCLPKQVQLVTSNPVGRINMKAELEAIGYISKDGINFIKE